MASVKNAAILLGLLGVADLLFIPTMTMGEPKAPVPAVILTAMLGVASIAAAYGLIKGIHWARNLGIASRVFDVISTIPVFFVGVPTVEMVGAVVMMALSVLSAYMLFKLAPAKAA